MILYVAMTHRAQPHSATLSEGSAISTSPSSDVAGLFGIVRMRSVAAHFGLHYPAPIGLDPGIEPSVGSTSDSHDNALAETVSGLFNTEEIYRRGPWKGLEDGESATARVGRVYNGSYLLEPLGYVPPAEFEQAYHSRHAAPVARRFSRNELSGKPEAVHNLGSRRF